MDLYGEAGWAGFNMSKVALMAGVGKSSLYSRWDYSDVLLRDAFTALVRCPGPQGASAREILVHEARFRLCEYLGPNRHAVRRLFVEAPHSDEPVLGDIYADVFVRPLAKIRARLWEFKSIGEFPAHASVTRMLDAIEGSVLMRTFCIPDDFIDCFLLKVPAYVEDLVDDQFHHAHSPSRQLAFS
ncbi:TetR/AcrR family transcriptional regulator [Schaalia suimastitidis]|uniref:TetR/AcrR family transcriptional regulator n=1 Tax=Schaalia suimastitidis TaxID=121163 RepID=UPI001F0A1944|nr:TetR/AcrR family transcriptional regulator [Schaalia suimastitidis]